MNCTSLLNPIAAPFALLLMFLYKFLQGSPDNESKYAYALALIFVAIFVRAIMLPFQMKSKLGMMRQTRLQPKLAEIQKRHAANKQKLNEETAKLYREEGVNPASSCLWSFIQMPIMLALFYAIRQPLSLMMRLGSELWETGGVIYTKLMDLYSQGALNANGEFSKELTKLIERGAQMPVNFEDLGFYSELYIAQEISDHWEVFRNLGVDGLHRISFYLGNINLAQVPNFRLWEFNWSDGTWFPLLLLFALPLISGGMQFLSASIMRKTQPQPVGADGKAPGAGMMKLMPLMSVFFGYMLPGALSLYWTIGTCLQIGQDIWLNKKYTKVLDAEDAEKEKARAKKEAELEAKRLESERLKAEGLALENKNISKKKKQALERQDKRQKAAEWEKKTAPAKEESSKDEPGRVGNRKFARGRAYDPDRYPAAENDVIDATDEETTIIDSGDDITGKSEDAIDADVIDVDTDENEDDYEGTDEE